MKKTLTLISCLLMVVQGFSFDKTNFRQQLQPLSFEENKGQVVDQYMNTRNDIQYALKTPGMTVFVGNGALHYQFYKTIKTAGPAAQLPNGIKVPAIGPIATYRMDVVLQGANIVAPVVTQGIVGRPTNYYTNPAIPDGFSTNAFQKVTYQNVYPGIDWVLYVQGSSLKYDFVVHPGANAADIKISYNGATALNAQDDGSIRAITPLGTITEQAPFTYQATDHKMIASRFAQDGNTLSFALQNNYNGTLVIDPSVAWATYYGTGNEGDINSSPNVACDPKGYVYLSGATNSPANIATSGSFQDTLAGGGPYFVAANAYLVKFDSTGKRIWATYYGGPNPGGFLATLGGAVACDNVYHIYAAGITSAATGIATSGSHQAALNTVAPDPNFGSPIDGFLVQFDTAGHRQWGTYFGGDGTDQVYGVACGPDNSVFLYGNTTSPNHIATTGSHQDTLGKETTQHATNVGNRASGFLAKFNTTGTVQWSTYYGDGNNPYLNGVSCDADNNIYLAGQVTTDAGTNNLAYITTGSFQATNGNGFDGILVKFNSAGVRQWGTYFHSTTTTTADGDDALTGVSCDKHGHVYVSGYTQNLTGIGTAGSLHSSPTQSAFINGATNLFLAQFTNAGVRNWCTYYGAGYGSRVACDANDAVWFAGSTNAIDSIAPTLSSHIIASTDVYQDKYIGNKTTANAFLVKFDSAGNRYWGSYYGGGEGAGGETVTGLVCDKSGSVYLSGLTPSAHHIATPGSYQDTLNVDLPGMLLEPGDMYLSKFAPLDVAVKNILADTVCVDTAAYVVSLQNGGGFSQDTVKVTTIVTNNGTGVSDTLTAATTSVLNAYSNTNFTVGNIVFAANTTYTIQTYIKHIKDDGSYANDTVTKTVVTKVCPTQGVNTVTTDKHIKIYPNPTTGIVQLFYYGITQKSIEVTVMNNVGQQVLYNAYTGTNGNFTTTIDLGQYPRGIYFIRTNVDDKIVVNKIVLQ